MIPTTRFVNEERREKLFDAKTIANAGSDTTARVSSEGVREVEVLVVGSADHNFDVQFLVAGEEGGTLHPERSVDASGGVNSVSFEETVLLTEYAIKITNNDGASSRDYDVYVIERV